MHYTKLLITHLTDSCFYLYFDIRGTNLNVSYYPNTQFDIDLTSVIFGLSSNV